MVTRLMIALLCCIIAGHAGGAADDAEACALLQVSREYTKAIAACTEALRHGETSELYSNRGSAHLMLDQLDQAVADLNRAVELDPTDAVRYYNRGTVFSRRADNARAIADYTEALRLKPDLVPAYVNRAHEFEKAGDKKRAIADYQEAVRLAPSLRGAIDPILMRLVTQ